MRKKRILVHPFLFAIVPILLLQWANISIVALQAVIRPLIISLITTAILIILIWMLIRDWEITSMISSLVLLFFFSYGHIFNGFLVPKADYLYTTLKLIGNHRNLGIAWVLLFSICIWIVFKLKDHIKAFNDIFTVMGVLLLVVSLFNILRYEFLLQQPWNSGIPSQLITDNSVIVETVNKPDIYYIILDGYGRSDILEDLYGYQNEELTKYLKQNGFLIAESSRSNYLNTAASLSSSLNMSYLDSLTEQYGQGQTSDFSPFTRLIRDNDVIKILDYYGYQTVGFSTGHKATELNNSDVYLTPPQYTSSLFEGLVTDTSALVLVQDIRNYLAITKEFAGYLSHIERINFTFDNLTMLPEMLGPKFIFAHVISPHPPFVFNASGEYVEQKYSFSIADGSDFIGTTDEYIHGYQAQIKYIDQKLKDTITAILEKSISEPIIIIQSDHGPGSQFDWYNPDKIGLNERSAILNAYYVPSEIREKLYDEISPVNTFRLVLNELFDYQMPLLPDISYYSNWAEPYHFVQIKFP